MIGPLNGWRVFVYIVRVLKPACYRHYHHGSQELHWHADPRPVSGRNHSERAGEGGGVASETAAGLVHGTSYTFRRPELPAWSSPSHDAYSTDSATPTDTAEYKSPYEHTFTKTFACCTSRLFESCSFFSVIIVTGFIFTCITSCSLFAGIVTFDGYFFGH